MITAKGKTKTRSRANASTKAKARPKVKAKAKTGTKAKTKAGTKTGAKARARAKAGTKAGTQSRKVAATNYPDQPYEVRKYGHLRFLGVRESESSWKLIDLVEKGLPAKSTMMLARSLAMPESEFTAKYAGIPRQTLSRRKQAGKLSANESDRVMRYAQLLQLAIDMMEGDQDAAVEWLKSPVYGLNERVPLDLARTEAGARDVEDIIWRIEWGVYT